MAFNFIKKVFSFGRKQAEENEQAAQQTEELQPLDQPEQAGPGPQEPQPSPPPPPEPTPAPEPVEPEPIRPEIEPATLEPRPAPVSGSTQDTAPTPPSPLRGGSIGEADRSGVAEEPGATVEEPSVAERAPLPPVEGKEAATSPTDSTAEANIIEEEPAPDVEETSSAAETTPSGTEPALGLAEGKTRGGHLPLEGGEDVAPVSGSTQDVAPPLPSPSRGGSIGEADRDGVAEGPGAEDEVPSPAEPPPFSAPDGEDGATSPAPDGAEEAPSAAETTPSGTEPALGLAEGKTRGGHLPLEGGEDGAPVSGSTQDVAPPPPSPLRGGSIGEADRDGVAEGPGAEDEVPSPAEPPPFSAPDGEDGATSPAPDGAEEAPSAAETTPSGTEPALGLAEGKTRGGHLPLKGEENAASMAGSTPGVAPTPPSPSRGGSIGEVDRGRVAAESGATEEAPHAPESRSADQTRGAVPSPAGRVTVSKKVEQKAAPAKPAEAAPRLSWFQRLKQGLSRSSKELSGNIAGVFTKRKLDEDTLQDLEDVLIRADLGMETAIRVTDALASGRYGKNVSDEEVRAIMAEEVEKVLKPVALPLELDLSHKPHVILVVGVNGTGKTTTIGKLAAKLTEGGLSVTLAAGDTFRAAAIEQLKIWGERTGSPVVSSKLGADAAGLAYDAFEKAKEAGSDVLIVDTAGRLQNKAELMAELEKIVRVLGKLDPEAPHTVLQTVDATTGQNALNQVEIFRNVAGVNGLVMTKLDGTARGGILVAIAAKHKLPVYFIGVGEQVDDLEPFSASDFAKAIAGVA